MFFEGDDVSCIYFLKEGSCSYVLPKHDNQSYIDISIGSCFGIIDIIGSCYKILEIDVENWITRKDLMSRQNTILANDYCECMTISTQDLYRMQLEFQEHYDQLFTDQTLILEKILIVKLGLISQCSGSCNEHQIPTYTSNLLEKTSMEKLK